MRTAPRRFCCRIGVGPLLAAACFSASGCLPRDPLDTVVRADTYTNLSIWEQEASDRIDPAAMDNFKEALQQIRFKEMAHGISGTENVDEAARAIIDGHTVRYVTEYGLSWEMLQAVVEQTLLEKASHANSRARIRPGDTESAEVIKDVIRRQEARLREVDARVIVLKRKLFVLELQPVLDSELPGPPADGAQPESPDRSAKVPDQRGEAKSNDGANP